MLALVFVTHTPMRNKIIMAVSLKIFLKHQQQISEDFSKSFRRDNYFVLVAMVAEYRSKGNKLNKLQLLCFSSEYESQKMFLAEAT